jgi:hypothetical protein
VASFIPGVNVPASLYNTVSYGLEGHTGEAVLSAAAIIPGGKWVTTAGKGIAKGIKWFRAGRDAEKAARDAGEAAKVGEELTAARPPEIGTNSNQAFGSSEPLVDRAAVATTISPQRQGRHLMGAPQYREGGYFKDQADAQKVLDAFHNRSATILNVTNTGQIKVKYPGVTGYNNNPKAGYLNQPTDVFLIKGTKSVSVVPTSPN